ncbi:type IV secretion system protein [Pseudomonas sp. DCB_CB]|uniref:type IV secretion system protein n=1 Tax=unclassified Pseudomonas TaxID=196821 RepID=UPI00224942BC|nr:MULTISPECIES: type IV secretion system protein [unclassified Pseudomonas]MCX2694514.1 type IV secretion system protein [Pseudomonas sp. DCB_BZ]MCX2859656.1 type IV secretion system protein [Pseudomonas sp. DCB_CB]
MATTTAFYTRMFAELNIALSTYITEKVSAVILSITPATTSLFTLYVMLWGWASMRGAIQEPITDGINRILKMSLIGALAINAGIYNSYISDLLWRFPDALGSLMAFKEGPVLSSAPLSNVQFLDVTMGKMFDLGNAYWQKANAGTIPSIGLNIVAILIWAFGVVVTAYGAFLLALSKIALALLLAVGPFFIVLSIFDATKKFVEAWIGQAFNYIVLTGLVSGCLALMLKILYAYLGAVAGKLEDPSIVQALPAVAFCLVGVLVMVQLPSIASSLGGGVAISTMGAANALYKNAKQAAGGAKDLASGKTLSDMRGQRRQKMANERWAKNNPGVTARVVGAATRKVRQG